MRKEEKRREINRSDNSENEGIIGIRRQKEIRTKES